ncbi:MAG: hypothetical protein ABIH92_01130 [Nanoarchaeota archaeon]
MGRECKVCGRTLKTGRKYCYLHKHGHEYKKKEDYGVSKVMLAIIVACLIFVILIFVFASDSIKSGEEPDNSGIVYIFIIGGVGFAIILFYIVFNHKKIVERKNKANQ